MTTFYEQGSIRITEQRLVVDSRSYAVPELRNLRIVQGPSSRIAGAAGGMAAGFLLAAIIGWRLISTPGQWFLAVLMVFGSALVALIAYRLQPRACEIWAEYRGSTVQLYWTRNRRTFGQVSRALVRARQVGDGAGGWTKSAPTLLGA